MKLTDRAKKYLKKKRQGGFINERGNTYESYFTLFHILGNANKYYANLSAIIYSSQENAFVDDLLVIENRNRLLYQLKTSKKISWGSNRTGTLGFDFVSQKKIEESARRTFELTLVVAFAKLQRNLTSKMPVQLKRCAKVFYFPCHNSLNKQILRHSRFKIELTSLLSMGNPTTDKLEALAACILGCWEASTKKNILLSDIISKVENIGYSFIKSRVIHNLSISTIAILDAIPDFTYLEAGGYFAWKYKTTDSGILPYRIGTPDFNSIESKIQINKPIDFNQLEILIS